MKKLRLGFLGAAVVIAWLAPLELSAGQRRKVVVVRPKHVKVRQPARHTKLVIRTGHPIRRVMPATVVVRPARRTVVVGAPLVYLPAVAWTSASVSLPSSERLAWQDGEEIAEEEGWVDTNFGVDSSGNALFLQIDGRAELNFAEVSFADGNVQVVDFNERTHGDGIYRLLDFADGRHVKTVRLLAKSKSDETRLTVYLSRS
jgi:hypothetical protein